MLPVITRSPAMINALSHHVATSRLEAIEEGYPADIPLAASSLLSVEE